MEPSTLHERPPRFVPLTDGIRSLCGFRQWDRTTDRQTPCSTLKSVRLAPKARSRNALQCVTGSKSRADPVEIQKNGRAKFGYPNSRPRLVSRSVLAAFHLLERVVDPPLVVFLRQVAVDDLRRDHH